MYPKPESAITTFGPPGVNWRHWQRGVVGLVHLLSRERQRRENLIRARYNITSDLSTSKGCS